MAFNGFAQQQAQFSLSHWNPYMLNVAYAGAEGVLAANANVRKQWVALEGSPLTQQVDVSLPWAYAYGGAGVAIQNDVIGAERTSSVALSYNYIVRLGARGAIASVGVAGGISQKAIDGTKLRAPEGDYEGGSINHNDLQIPNTKVSALAPLLHVGALYKANQLEVGVGVQNIAGNTLKYRLEGFADIQQQRALLLHAKGTINLTPNVGISPAMLLKTDFIQTQAEINATAGYQNKFFGGLGIRGYNKNTLDAVIISIALQATEQIRLAYAYDVGISALNSAHQGSHELLVSYRLDTPIGNAIQQKIIHTPRFN